MMGSRVLGTPQIEGLLLVSGLLSLKIRVHCASLPGCILRGPMVVREGSPVSFVLAKGKKHVPKP